MATGAGTLNPGTRTRSGGGAGRCARPCRRPRPASTAWRIASAMTSGSRASAMAVPTSTAWQPSSMASVASEAVPIPRGHDDRNRRRVEDEADRVGVADPEPRSRRRRLEQDGRRAGLLEPPDGDRIVARHRQRDEPVPGEGAGRLENRREVRHLGPGIPDHVDLHEVAESRLPREVRRSHRLVRRPAPGGGRDQGEAPLVDRRQEGAARTREVEVPDGQRSRAPTPAASWLRRMISAEG